MSTDPSIEQQPRVNHPFNRNRKGGPALAAGAVVLVLSAVGLGWLHSEKDWSRIDIYSDVYASQALCETDWGRACRFDSAEGKYLGPFYEGQICESGSCRGYFRPVTSANHERVAIYQGAGEYVKTLKGGTRMRREPKPNEALGNVQILSASSIVPRDQSSR